MDPMVEERTSAISALQMAGLINLLPSFYFILLFL
jgi:hypothetical protein